MPILHRFLGPALVLLLVLSFSGGCWLVESEQEEAPVYEGEKKGSGNFDHDYEIPAMPQRPEFSEESAGYFDQVLVTTGRMFATMSPDGEFLNLLQADEIYGDFPVPAPDGKKFVAYGDPEGWKVPFEHLYLGDLQTGEIDKVAYAPDVFYEYPATWTPGGQKIIFTGIEDKEEWKVNIYYVDFAARTGGLFLEVSELGFYDDVVESCAMHPFNNVLYIIGWQKGAPAYGVYAYDLDQESLERVAYIWEDYAYHVAVSPDGSQLAVTAGESLSEERIETFGLYLIDISSGETDLVFWEEGLQAVFSSFSPDLSELLICTDTRIFEDTWSIYSYDLKTGEGEVWTRQRYNTGFEPFSPSWTEIAR